MIVDSHAHLVPPALLASIRAEAQRFPSVRLIEQDGSLAFSFSGAKPTRPVSKPLSDIAARTAWMTKNGIDRQVVGGWVDMFGYELPAAEGRAWAELINAHLAAAARFEPRFVPLATVPLQEGAAAAQVLRAAISAGFPGVMIGTLPRGIGSVLDAPDLAPFWQAADEAGAVVHIHPSFDAGDARVNDYGLANAVGRVTDAMIAVSRLIAAGHVTRHANARIVVPMGAAGLPFLLGRLTRNYAITAGLGDPGVALRHIYTDTILHDPRVLRFVVDMMGADRVMLGSDMPFPIGDSEPARSSRTPASHRSRQRASAVGLPALSSGSDRSTRGTAVKLEINGAEVIAAPLDRMWASLNDPDVLCRCIPGCRSMRMLAPDTFAISLDIKVASVGGSFEGEISLSDKMAPTQCRISISGNGTLGHGSGEAHFKLEPADGGTLLAYDGAGEIGGLVAGVGQRVLRGVSKHLIGRFFKSIRSELEAAPAVGAPSTGT